MNLDVGKPEGQLLVRLAALSCVSDAESFGSHSVTFEGMYLNVGFTDGRLLVRLALSTLAAE
jgi:hypothetical protein